MEGEEGVTDRVLCKWPLACAIYLYIFWLSSVSLSVNSIQLNQMNVLTQWKIYIYISKAFLKLNKGKITKQYNKVVQCKEFGLAAE